MKINKYRASNQQFKLTNPRNNTTTRSSRRFHVPKPPNRFLNPRKRQAATPSTRGLHKGKRVFFFSYHVKMVERGLRRYIGLQIKGKNKKKIVPISGSIPSRQKKREKLEELSVGKQSGLLSLSAGKRRNDESRTSRIKDVEDCIKDRAAITITVQSAGIRSLLVS